MKCNYYIDISLLKSLKINVKEAIVLDFFYYYNNRNIKSYKMPITKIAEHLNITRSYLYKILSCLIKRKLIVKDCREFIVSENYKQERSRSFKENNKKTSTAIIAKKDNKIIENNKNNKMYSNETKLYSNETDSILYIDTNIQYSSIKNARVDIGLSCEQDKSAIKSKIKNIFDLIDLFRNEIANGTMNMESFEIPKRFVTEIASKCKKEIHLANDITLYGLKNELDSSEYELFEKFIKRLANTGIFIIKENKKLMINTIQEILKQGGNLKALIEDSINKQSLWIGDNRLGIKALNNLWDMLENKFKEIEANKQQLIMQVSQKYKDSIKDFINYRNSKGRYFNSFAFNKFLLELTRFECLKIDIVKAINQSIERGYNWVFKPTHRARYFIQNKKYHKELKDEKTKSLN